MPSYFRVFSILSALPVSCSKSASLSVRLSACSIESRITSHSLSLKVFISGINTSTSSLYSVITLWKSEPMRSLLNSDTILSLEILHKSSLFFRMLSDVNFSILKPSTELNLRALRILSPSSPNLSSGSPTHLIILLSISEIPPNKSTIPFLPYAIALMVKSLLRRSSAILSVKNTVSGCLLSV